ncbi:MAG: hypothetical protein M1296_03795 [Chloroflexi bacterium]|nr:hypothetical protein [Chloroflexota bacterium]
MRQHHGLVTVDTFGLGAMDGRVVDLLSLRLGYLHFWVSNIVLPVAAVLDVWLAFAYQSVLNSPSFTATSPKPAGFIRTLSPYPSLKGRFSGEQGGSEGGALQRGSCRYGDIAASEGGVPWHARK